MSTTSSSSTEPDSPLTPIAEEYPADAVPEQTEPRVILVPPPLGPLTVSSLNLNTHVIRNYRAIVKSAITEFKLDINRPLSEQEPKSRDEARTRSVIESSIARFKQHQGHWGADILLRDQLKKLQIRIRVPYYYSFRAHALPAYHDLITHLYKYLDLLSILLGTLLLAAGCLHTPFVDFPFIFHQLPVAMPRTVYAVCMASALTQLSIRGYHMSDTHNGSVPVPTAAPRSKSDTLRRPQIDYWLPPNAQAFIHDVTIMYHGERFRVYFRRYRMLPTNPLLKVNGGIVILRMGKQNPLNPINMQCGDTKKARAIARKFAPYLAWFQEDCLRELPSHMILS
ncbi:hypothetical protein DFJ43DRAFT_1157903 [Lentinula guzmanii]|uniref:Uncharacterized protein n=1 Tax=Lentinula guzmanii TaxID=2804957 RepID=A0AA38JI25_9AGAR|nr:hypothetical protein DFJ43DRAFT_1157903 [Lentinula guzmanii]